MPKAKPTPRPSRNRVTVGRTKRARPPSNAEAKRSKPKKKARHGIKPSSSGAIVDCENQLDSAFALTFRSAWEARAYHDNALWLEVPVDVRSSLGSSLAELVKLRKIRHDRLVVGVEVESNGPLLRLQTRRSRVDVDFAHISEAPMLTAMTLRDVFPNTSDTWIKHLVEIVEKDLVVVELRPVQYQQPELARSRAKKPAKTPVFDWRLHLGVNWCAYMELCQSKPAFTPNPRVTLHRCMHDVMLWGLQHSQSLPGQWTYPYPKEIGALYASAIGDEDAKPSNFDIGAIHSQINASRQLQRDTSCYLDAASDSLIPVLREYQKAAVAWMMEREARAVDQSASHVIVSCIEFASSPSVRYDPFQACFFLATDDLDETSTVETATPITFDLASVRGGILADEMGLGKTVEVIALVLSNPSEHVVPRIASNHFPGVTTDDGVQGKRHCVCGSIAEHPRGWVQCEFCGSMHHQICTGFDAERCEFVFSIGGGKVVVQSEFFMCFACQSRERPDVQSKTTLIVSPETIHHQWELEITRHVKPGVLKVLRYPGVKALYAMLKKQPSEAWQVLASACFMGAFDVVLTTYEALGSDLHHLPSSSGSDRRSSTRQKTKKYPFVASPLVFLDFWRVCMDEAQVGVENPRLLPALTVAELRTQSTWIVTGTPFSTSIADLFGAFKFLRIAPFDDDRHSHLYFKTVVEQCFARGAVDRVLDMLLWDGDARQGGGLFWRTAKKDVLDQLKLPGQHEEVVWCRFSGIERHLYDQQAVQVSRAVRRFGPADSAGDSTVDAKVWSDLLQLRRLCCHPSVSSTLGKAHVQTLDDLISDMVTKASRRCASARRAYIASQNGLAALCAIEQDWSRAVELYLDSLDVSCEAAGDLTPDDLLCRLHLAVNMADCVRTLAADMVVPTESMMGADADHVPELQAIREAVRSHSWMAGSVIEDLARLEAYAAILKSTFLVHVELEHGEKLNEAETAWRATNLAIGSTEVSRPVLCRPSVWWKKLLRAIASGELGLDPASFIDHLRARLLATNKPWNKSFAAKFTSVQGCGRAITDSLVSLQEQRAVLIDSINKQIRAAPSEGSIAQWQVCRSCRLGADGPPCSCCRLERTLMRFERRIMGFEADEDTPVDDEVDGSTNRHNVSWDQSPVFVGVFKAMVATVRDVGDRSIADQCLKNIESEVSLWVMMKREVVAIKQLVKTHRERLSALHQIASVVERFRVIEPLESDFDKIDVVDIDGTPHGEPLLIDALDVPDKRVAFEAEQTAAQIELGDARSKLQYLQRLETQRGDKQPTAQCSICLEPMNSERVMLPCAHSFCSVCVMGLPTHGRSSRRTNRETIVCPMCRASCAAEDLVQFHQEGGADEAAGEFSCKVDAIVHRVAELSRREARVKCLLFSQWPSMLNITREALQRHDVQCFAFDSKRAMQQAIHAFKAYDGDKPSVLLLPYRHGSNGLNVVEATEVLLAEPQLNVGVEQQAVNRVYRIGQTRSTRVHRFLVKDSVEERIHNAKHLNKAEDTSVTAETAHHTSKANVEDRASLGEVRRLLSEEAPVVERPPEVINDRESETLHPFWSEMVTVDARHVSREEALAILETRTAEDAATTMAKPQRSIHNARTYLLGKQVGIAVALELVELECVDGANKENEPRLSPNVLAFHQMRLRVELKRLQSNR